MTNRREAARRRQAESRSLDQIEGATSSPPEGGWPRQVREARRVPLKDLTPAALLALLHQGTGVVHLLPWAIAAAERDPWATVEFHAGDLLLAVLRTDPGYWQPGTVHYQQMLKLARTAAQQAKTRRRGERSPETESDVQDWLAARRQR